MEQEKKCKNCKYFIEHYVKDGTHLFGLGQGENRQGLIVG